MPWLPSSSGAVVVLKPLILVKQVYKATLQLVAQVPLQLGGSTLCQGRRCQFVTNPDVEGYLPITPPFLVLHTLTQFHE